MTDAQGREAGWSKAHPHDRGRVLSGGSLEPWHWLAGGWKNVAGLAEAEEDAAVKPKGRGNARGSAGSGHRPRPCGGGLPCSGPGPGWPCLVSRDRSPAESEHGKPGPPLRGFPSNTGAYPSPRKSRVGGVSKSYFMKVISERFEYAPVGLGGTGGERSFPPSDMLLASFPLSRLQLLGVGVAGRQ